MSGSAELPRRPLGRTGLSLSTLGFGGGSAFCTIPDQDAVRLVDAAHAAGLRYFDTAPFYGSGLSEHRHGQALRRYPRDSFVLSNPGGTGAPRPGACPSRSSSITVMTGCCARSRTVCSGSASIASTSP